LTEKSVGAIFGANDLGGIEGEKGDVEEDAGGFPLLGARGGAGTGGFDPYQGQRGMSRDGGG